MGAGLRIFIVEDNDTLKRLSVSRYCRLLRYDREDRMPQWAGKKIRSALFVIEFCDRKPVSVIQEQYFYLYFDSHGRLDPNERTKAHKLIAQTHSSIDTDDDDFQSVIDARQRFAKKRFINDYTWRPSPELDKKIYGAIFDTERNSYCVYLKPWLSSSPCHKQLKLPF